MGENLLFAVLSPYVKHSNIQCSISDEEMPHNSYVLSESFGWIFNEEVKCLETVSHEILILFKGMILFCM